MSRLASNLLEGSVGIIYHGTRYSDLTLQKLRSYRHGERAGFGVCFSHDKKEAERRLGWGGRGVVIEADASALEIYKLKPWEQAFMMPDRISRKEFHLTGQTLRGFSSFFDGIDFGGPEVALEATEIWNGVRNRGTNMLFKIREWGYNMNQLAGIPHHEQEVFVFKHALGKLKAV